MFFCMLINNCNPEEISSTKGSQNRSLLTTKSGVNKKGKDISTDSSITETTAATTTTTTLSATEHKPISESIKVDDKKSEDKSEDKSLEVRANLRKSANNKLNNLVDSLNKNKSITKLINEIPEEVLPILLDTVVSNVINLKRIDDRIKRIKILILLQRRMNNLGNFSIKDKKKLRDALKNFIESYSKQIRDTKFIKIEDIKSLMESL